MYGFLITQLRVGLHVQPIYSPLFHRNILSTNINYKASLYTKSVACYLLSLRSSACRAMNKIVAVCILISRLLDKAMMKEFKLNRG